MIHISNVIPDGAEGFFNTKYGSISKMALLLALLIFAIYIFRPHQDSLSLGSFTTAFITVLSFLLGVVCSGMAGYPGGSALVVFGMAVLSVAILFATFYVCLGVDSPGSIKVTNCSRGCHTWLRQFANVPSSSSGYESVASLRLAVY
ncbi:pyrophosphate-energized membrane proton pump 2 isoform X1 [Tanacetum coccineum]